MTDERKWGWMQQHSETAQGPFDSHEEAIADARRSDGTMILVGRVTYPVPENHLPDWLMDHVLECMEEHAGDDEWGFAETELFKVRDKGKAEAALNDVIRAWIREHVEPTGVWMLTDEELVMLAEEVK